MGMVHTSGNSFSAFCFKYLNKSIFNLDSIQKATLYSILNSSTGLLQSYIRNTLIITDTLIYNEPYILPGGSLKSGKIRRIPIRKTYNEDNFRLYPNPAGNYVIIDYTMKNEYRNGIIQFFDNSGRLIKNISFNNDHDFLVIPLKDLPNGVYFCNFVACNKIVGSRKLIINK